MDLSKVWGPTYILKGYTMQFPTSDKIILRAARRLEIFWEQDDGIQDPWMQPENQEMIKAFEAFLLSCDECELKRVVALSNVCLNYAYMILDTLFANERQYDGFPFYGPSDLGKDPRQLSLI
jgi:hypothetical protein